MHIAVPPLRELAEEYSDLERAFVKTYAAKHGRATKEISKEALRLLAEYEFPGNVRELANTIERAVIVSGSKQLEVPDLPESIRAAVAAGRKRKQPQTLAEVEADYVQEILEAAKGNKTEAARILGISRKNLYEKLARRERMKDEG